MVPLTGPSGRAISSQPLLVISTVGTSLLTNQLSPQEKTDGWDKRVRDTANLTQQEMEPETKVKIDELAERALSELKAADVRRRRQLSAELNGLYGIYNDNLACSVRDMHFLQATDTYQGRMTAEVLREFLRSEGLTADTCIPPRLSTLDTEAFEHGIKELIRWCDECIPGYKDRGYQVVFNLVGGFKAVHSYMHTIGMFYADRITYVFEGSNSLVNIPRLPVRIEDEALLPYATYLLMMEKGYLCPVSYLEGISEVVIDSDGSHAFLSSWGQLLLAQLKRKKALSERLLEFPYLDYAESFKEDFRRAEVGDRIRLQETLAKVSKLLSEHHGSLSGLRSDPGLQYEDLVNSRHGGRPIGHFRINDSMRATCVSIPRGPLLLRRFGPHSIIERP